jgi:hypothetical protein
MNKLKTVGISALAGSLATLSAYAGDVSVTGGMDISYVNSEKAQANSNPIGLNNAFTFSKAGELDNGWTWAAAVIYLGGNDVIGNISTSHVTFTMGDMGSLMIGNNAEAIGSIDDVMPTAYEESWNGLDSGPALVGMGNGNMVTYTSPDLGGGTNIVLTWDPAAGGSSTGTGGETTGGGDTVLEFAFKNTGAVEGLTLGGGVAEEDRQTSSVDGGYGDKPWEATLYAKYAAGPITVGYQESAEDPGVSKGQGTSAQHYENRNWAVSFQVNDDLTVSYSDFESTKALNSDAADVTLEIDSLQFSYSMGAMSIRLQDSDMGNSGYVAGTDEEHTELNISLSF